MALAPTPTVYINNRRVACTPSALDREPVAIRGYEIKWGRDDYHDADAEPASIRLHLADSTDTWAHLIRTSQAIGQTIEIKLTGTNDKTGETQTWTQFRGRVSHAVARPMSSTGPQGERRWEITLDGADRTADMGSKTVTENEWPQEHMLIRAVRIRDYGKSAGSGIDDIFFFPGYTKSTCGPLDTQRATPLALMGDMYRSMGNDSWAYDPDGNAVRQVIRLAQELDIHLGAFDDTQGAVIPVVNDITVDNVVYEGIGLGSCELVGEPEIAADVSTGINRLECRWKDHGTGHQDWTTVKEQVPAGGSVRTMTWDSWFDAGEIIDPTLANVWNRVRQEGARPRHPAIELHHRKSFPTFRHAHWWLHTWENTRPAYLAGSLPWLWLMGGSTEYPPVVAPIGGVTSYDPRYGWTATIRVHWIQNLEPVTSKVRWEDLPQLQVGEAAPLPPWWDMIPGLPKPRPKPVGERVPERDLTWGEAADDVGYRFGNSVTWGDMRNVPTWGAQIVDHV